MVCVWNINVVVGVCATQDMKSDLDNTALMMSERGLRKSVRYLPRVLAWVLSV